MSVCDIPVISAVCETAGEAAATLVSAPFGWLASSMGQAAGWLLETMWQVFDSTTLVDVTNDGYLDVYNLRNKTAQPRSVGIETSLMLAADSVIGLLQAALDETAIDLPDRHPGQAKNTPRRS